MRLSQSMKYIHVSDWLKENNSLILFVGGCCVILVDQIFICLNEFAFILPSDIRRRSCEKIISLEQPKV